MLLRGDSDFEQVVVTGSDGEPLILVKVAGVIHAYRNRCPHIGVPLDYGDGDCLAGPNELLCTLHGARFVAETGHCTIGPCAGDHLERVAIRCDAEGRIFEDA